jgi:hypothetical protein
MHLAQTGLSQTPCLPLARGRQVLLTKHCTELIQVSCKNIIVKARPFYALIRLKSIIQGTEKAEKSYSHKKAQKTQKREEILARRAQRRNNR